MRTALCVIVCALLTFLAHSHPAEPTKDKIRDTSDKPALINAVDIEPIISNKTSANGVPTKLVKEVDEIIRKHISVFQVANIIMNSLMKQLPGHPKNITDINNQTTVNDSSVVRPIVPFKEMAQRIADEAFKPVILLAPDKSADVVKKIKYDVVKSKLVEYIEKTIRSQLTNTNEKIENELDRQVVEIVRNHTMSANITGRCVLPFVPLTAMYLGSLARILF